MSTTNSTLGSNTPLLNKNCFRNIRKGQTFLLLPSKKLPPKFPRSFENERVKLLKSELGKALQRHGLVTAEEIIGYFGTSGNCAITSIGVKATVEEIRSLYRLAIKTANKHIIGQFVAKILQNQQNVVPLNDAVVIQGEFDNFEPPLSTTQAEVIIKHPSKIRHQGDNRGTCVSMAACYLLEKALARDKRIRRILSPEYNWWMTKQNDGLPNENGTEPYHALQSLRQHGTCEEHHWPYTKRAPDTGVVYWPPRRVADRQITFYHARAVYQLPNPKDIDALKNCIASDHPVAIKIPIFEKAHEKNGNFLSTGNSPMPFDDDVISGNHAVALVGYLPQQDLDAPDFSGSGAFVFRNSWGHSFGKSGAFGKGYGTLPFNFLAQFCAEAYILEA